MKQVIIRIPDLYRQQLKIRAAQEGTSVQKLIEEALEHYEKTKFVPESNETSDSEKR